MLNTVLSYILFRKQ